MKTCHNTINYKETKRIPSSSDNFARCADLSTDEKDHEKKPYHEINLPQWEIIVINTSKMFPYYQLYCNLPTQHYQFQEETPFIPWNCANNFTYINPDEYHKWEIDQSNLSLIVQRQHEDKNLSDLHETVLKEEIPYSYVKPLDNEEISIENSEHHEDLSKFYKDPSISKTKHTEQKKKGRSEKKDKAYVAKQYPKQEPSIKCRYIQKNFELNIINQVFSFLWSEEKSEKYVSKYLGNEVKTTLFYEFIKVIKKFCKRYINKEYLKNLCAYQNHHIAYKMVTKNQQKVEYLSMLEFSKCIRYLIFIYLHELCPQAILTSKKMRREIWGEHLSKCRLLRNFLFNKLTAEEYEKKFIGGEDVVSEVTEEN